LAFEKLHLIIVHYHLRPGGIRRVIELATPYLLARLKSVARVTLACGEAADQKWNQQFTRLVAPLPVEFTVAPAWGYFSEQTRAPKQIRSQCATALGRLLAGANSQNTIIWAHNLGIGRNLLLARELASVCQTRGIPLISHHHDWWFDNRWRRWPELRRAGFRDLKAVATAIFPPANNLRHAGINAQESAVLCEQLDGRAGWLPNPVPRISPPKHAAIQSTKGWLEHTLREHGAPIWLLPCRLLRRKNVAEALLLTRWLRPEAWLVTTGGASSADEQYYFETIQRTAHQHHWRLRLGVLSGDETRKPSVPELLAASEAVLLTSIQEGFGLPYVEAAAANRPLIARNLANVAPDLHKFGFRLPQAYDEILVSTWLFDWKAERARQDKLFSRWRRQLPESLQSRVDLPEVLRHRKQPMAAPFSRLTLTAQLEVLAQPRLHSWELCAPLNWFLSGWQSQAARKALELTNWPRRADHWLSGPAYARKFVRLLHSQRAKAAAPDPAALQAALMEKKLCAENLYPLLWTTVS